MRANNERAQLAEDVARLIATRSALSDRLHMVVTALALSTEAQALAQARLDDLGADGKRESESAEHLQGLAQGYRRLLATEAEHIIARLPRLSATHQLATGTDGLSAPS